MVKRAKVAAIKSSARKRTLEELQAAGVDLDTITSCICNNLDRTVGRIIELVKEKFGVELNREQPYEILRRAAAAGRLHYAAPLDSDLAVKLLEGHEWLRRARVIRSSSPTDIAWHAALVLLDLVEKWDKPELHIGIAGGGLMAETVRFWAGFLKRSANLKLGRLFVHALVAATYDPRRSPHGFVQWLLEDAFPFKTEFVGLPTPAFISSSGLAALRVAEGVRDAFDHAADLDIVITSAGAHWERGCGGLNNRYKEVAPRAVRALEEAGCIGDVIWQPFGPTGPITKDVGPRAVSLLDLRELPTLVRAGKRVLLVLAPCGGAGCGEPKSAMLRAVLGWRDGVTDLVVDARAAALAVRR